MILMSDPAAFIASVIASTPDHAPSLRTAKVSSARSFAVHLARIDPEFNLETFAEACGLEACEGSLRFPEYGWTRQKASSCS